jgi:hypothetical protein
MTVLSRGAARILEATLKNPEILGLEDAAIDKPPSAVLIKPKCTGIVAE